MSEPTPKRPWLCGTCNQLAAWRESIRDIFLAGLNGQAALPMSVVFGLFLVFMLLGDGERRERVMIKFMESPLFAWGGWLACIVFALAFVFCWKTIIAAKDAQIKALERAKQPAVAEQMLLSLEETKKKAKP